MHWGRRKLLTQAFWQFLSISELCPRAWIYLEGFCYKFSSQSLTWNAAKTACKNMESTLAVVASEEKQIAIAAKLPKAPNHWIGLYRDPEDTSRWLWIDSSRLCEGCGYWSSGRPDNSKADKGCGAMGFWISGRWYDQSCSVRLHYTCQKRGWYYSFVDKGVVRENYFIVINWLRAGSRVRNFLIQNKRVIVWCILSKVGRVLFC